MRKRTNMNVDMTLLERARHILSTRGTTETVHAALEEVVRRDKLRRLASRDLPDLTPDALEQMRQPRLVHRDEHAHPVSH